MGMILIDAVFYTFCELINEMRVDCVVFDLYVLRNEVM